MTGTGGRAALGAVAMAVWGQTAVAATMGGYAGVTVFGDSLSDPGNAAAAAELAGETFPPEFPLGKASDGALWSETVLQAFTAAGLPARNFAVATARIGAVDDLAPPDLGFQLATFVATGGAASLRPEELGVFWLGGNDMRDALSAPGASAESVGAAAQAAVTSLLGQAQGSAAAGFDSVLFLNLPDFSRIPAFLQLAAQLEADVGPGAGDPVLALAQFATDSFNTALADGVSTLAGVHASVFDVNAVFRATLEAGLPGVDRPLAETCLDVIDPAVDDLAQCSEHFFYDAIHPSAALHAALAREIATVVQPARIGVIPLPASGWLLLGGLAGLGALARRRRA